MIWLRHWVEDPGGEKSNRCDRNQLVLQVVHATAADRLTAAPNREHVTMGTVSAYATPHLP
jgi:hypothetical protein